MNRLSFVFGVLLCLGMICQAIDYDSKYNKKRVEQINRFVLQQIDRQRAAYIKLRKEAAEANGEKKDGGDQNANPENGNQPAAPAKPKIVVPPKFYANIDEIKKQVSRSFKANDADAKGDKPKVDARSEIEIMEEARKIVSKKYPLSDEDILKLEREAAVKEYPLYKQGQVVEITFARGNEPRVTYRGSYRRLGQYKLIIGGKQLSIFELPEYYAARFDEKLNRKAREKMIEKHPLLSKIKLEREEALFNTKKELQAEQFRRNLPLGWVYVDDAWHTPVDLVESFVKTREINHANIKKVQQKYREMEKNPKLDIYTGADKNEKN